MFDRATSIIFAAALAIGFSSTAQADYPAIFDGQSLAGWTTLDGKSVTKGWEVVDGMIHLDTSGGRAGDIITQHEYRNFELRFQWKTEAGGNSGIKYRVKQYGKRTLGLEYQIIDDTGYRVQLPATGLTGSLYDIYAPNESKVLHPPGEFNSSRIVVRGNRIEHWLNGSLIVQACVGSADWHQRIAQSKFADYPGFGENRSGKIMLTDHKSQVWYRNIELIPLSDLSTCSSSKHRVKHRLVRRLLFLRGR